MPSDAGYSLNVYRFASGSAPFILLKCFHFGEASNCCEQSMMQNALNLLDKEQVIVTSFLTAFLKLEYDLHSHIIIQLIKHYNIVCQLIREFISFLLAHLSSDFSGKLKLYCINFTYTITQCCNRYLVHIFLENSLNAIVTSVSRSMNLSDPSTSVVFVITRLRLSVKHGVII